MAGWFAVSLTTSAAVAGLSVAAMTMRAPEVDHVPRDAVQREASVQSRLAFELLVKDYLAKFPSHVGELTVDQLRAAPIGSGALRNGDYPDAWKVTVKPSGDLAWCTPVASRLHRSFSSQGISLESLKCVG